MAVMFIIVRPQFLPRWHCDDQRTQCRKGTRHFFDKCDRLLDVLKHVQEQNRGDPVAQLLMNIGETSLRKDKRTPLIVDSWNTKIAAVRVEPGFAQDAIVMPPISVDFDQRIAENA